MNSIRKKAEQIVEKGVMGVSDAIHATGSAFERGGSKVTSFITSSAGAVGEFGEGIFNQACNLVGATKTSQVQEVLEANESFDDIMAEEEAEDQKIRQNARIALDRMSSDDKNMIGAISKKELDSWDALLPISNTPDAWQTAEPITKISESIYPFDENRIRPSSGELDDVYKIALSVATDPVNKEYQDELDAYIMKMFGKSKETHEGVKSMIAVDKKPTKVKLHLKLMDGKDLIACDANGKSDPYCYISIIKAEDQEMVTASKPNLEKLDEAKRLNLSIRKSRTVQRSLSPTWNESYQFELREKGDKDLIVIEVWDSDEEPVTFREAGFSKFGKFLKDWSDIGDDFMGRAFMPISAVGFTEKEKVLTLYSRNKRKQFGVIRILVSRVGEKPAVNKAKVMKEHRQLVANVLDFETHVTGKYIVGWNAKVTPLGYKLITLNAAMNGLSELDQVAILFPLLQLFDKHINMSIIGYFGVVHSLNCCQDQLPSSPTGSRQAVQKQEESQSECVRTIFTCLDSLDSTLIGVLKKHHQFFNFKSDEGIDYLALHVELIKEMYLIIPHVERLQDSKKNLHQTVHDACTIACVGWIGKLFAEAIPMAPKENERLLCFLEVMECIKQRLHNASARTIQSIFEEVGVDYYTLLYTIVDKQISAEIQDYLTNHITRGSIPSYQLYLHLRDVLKLARNIPTNVRCKLHLNEYHDWFTNLVADWLDAAAQKCNSEIKRAITGLDNVVTVTDNVKFSQSALSAAACFKRMATFWNNLDWPRIAEHYAFIIRVVENVSKAARFYVEESHKYLKKKGFHHDPTSKTFIVTQQLCISLNDIEYVREELSKIPETLQFNVVISRLGQVEGDSHAINARHTLMTLINTANDDMKYLINNLMSSVGEQMSKDISGHINNLIEADPKADIVKLLDPLMQYLSENLATFHSLSLQPVLEIAVEEIWNVIVDCYSQVVKVRLGQKAAMRLMHSVGELEAFFHAGGDGLPMNKIKTAEYKVHLLVTVLKLHLRKIEQTSIDVLPSKNQQTCETLGDQASSDDELIERHLYLLAKMSRNEQKFDSNKEAGNDSKNADKKANKFNNGQLLFSVGYIQDKETLEITVISGKNFPGIKSNGSSDPYVEIILMPEKRFKIKPVKTDFKSKDLNPTYYKDFKIRVKEQLLDMSGSVLSLAVFDHDYIKKNEFCGMVVLNCAEIPRLPTGSSGIDDPTAPQRKTIELHLVVDTTTSALKELSERNHQYVNDFNLWYKRGTTFAGNFAASFTGGFARAFSLKR